MKPILLLLSSTFLILHSCKNSIEKTNERIKSSILEKGKEIQENYIQYKLDIENSGYNNLLSFERIEKDKDYLESKEIIKKLILYSQILIKEINIFIWILKRCLTLYNQQII